jgi:O-antigen ligase
MGLVFLISAIRKWTARKAMVLGIAIIALLIFVPAALSSLETRFAHEQIEIGYDERAAFESAAMMMLSDHPMGVGANNYVVAANVQGYNAKAGVAPRAYSLQTNVHNAYLLTGAEAGYFGLITFVVMLLRPMLAAFDCGWRNRNDQRGDLLLGFGIALLMLYLHSFFEWTFFLFQLQYLFAMTVGLVGGLAQQLGYWDRVPRRSSHVGFEPIRANPTGSMNYRSPFRRSL